MSISAGAPEAGIEVAVASAPRAGSDLLHFGAFVLAQGIRMGLGLLFWVGAARLFDPREVGLGAGAVSAMMLCVLLSLWGVGSSVISLFPSHRDDPFPLLKTATISVLVAALCTSSLFVLVAAHVFEDLRVVSQGSFVLVFVGACVLGTLYSFCDELSYAVRGGDYVLGRAALFGGVTLLSLLVTAALWDTERAQVLFTCWLVGLVAAAVLAVVQLKRLATWRSPVAPGLGPRRLFRVGLPNHAMSLADASAGLVMPLVITEAISPQTNAYWYAVWMGAVGVNTVPAIAGMLLFAEVADEGRPRRRTVARRLGLGLGLGIFAAAALAALAPTALGLLGDEYAEAGTTPLRILVLGVVPVSLFFAYSSVCRATRRFREIILLSVAASSLTLAFGAAAGDRYGLTGIACAWVAVQLGTGVWAAWRLFALVDDPRSGSEATDPSSALSPA